MADGRVLCLRPERTGQAGKGGSDAGLERRLKDVFGPTIATMTCEPGQHFFLEGDPPGGVHIVRHGAVIVYSITEAGGRHIQQIARAGECFAVNFSHDHRLNAQALNTAQSWHLPKRIICNSVEEDRAARELVFDLMDQQLLAARFRSELLSSKSAMQKCAAFLLAIEDPQVSAEVPYTAIALKRIDIADYLGLTLETVSRMFNRLKKLELIELPRHDLFRIADRHRMNALARDLYSDAYRLAS
jgi:CRP/FNR family transcriptional regulator, anaerobic regulatory protein